MPLHDILTAVAFTGCIVTDSGRAEGGIYIKSILYCTKKRKAHKIFALGVEKFGD